MKLLSTWVKLVKVISMPLAEGSYLKTLKSIDAVYRLSRIVVYLPTYLRLHRRALQLRRLGITTTLCRDSITPPFSLFSQCPWPFQAPVTPSSSLMVLICNFVFGHFSFLVLQHNVAYLKSLGS